MLKGWQTRYFTALIASFFFLTACAITTGAGSTHAFGFNDSVIVALATNAEVRETATTLLQANKITKEDANNVLKQTDAAREAINIAIELNKTGSPAANDKLVTARSILAVIQTYLNTRK